MRVHTSTHVLQIMTPAQIDFDPFILFLKNSVLPTDHMPQDKRLKQTLKFIALLKTRYQEPVIALYGWPKQGAYRRRATLAGAEFVFIIPSKLSELRAAVAECLEPVLKAGVDTELLETKEPKGENNGKPSSTE